jgi:hypothetical protein
MGEPRPCCGARIILMHPKSFWKIGDLTKLWGNGERKWLFVPEDWHDHVNELLAGHLYTVSTLADKTLYTDRPVTLH